MELENGDDYVRRIASFIRTNEQRLAQGTISRRHAQKPVGSMSVLAWMGIGITEETRKPLVFTEDPHHLFYLLMRFESVGIDVGSLDVRVQNPTRPTSISHLTMMKHKDKSDVLSISSLRSSMSSVSMFSLGGGWLGRSQPASLDVELKYLYSAFTKVPALRVRASGHRVISELAKDPPTDSAIPMDAFKNLQALECLDIDPRILMGWDRLSENLKSLTVKRSGIEDVSELLIDSVVDDKARRDGSPVRVARPRLVHRPPSVRSRQPSIHAAQLPLSIPEVNEEVLGTSADESPSTHLLPSYSWSLLRHLSLSDNSLTFLPSLPPLPSLSSLDISANLLISIPPALSALPALRSLNLANNMIDSVLGIYSQIPSIVALNLSANRLESLCGLERLDHLTRVDIRENRVDDIDEVGRLADLHDIKEIWLSGNPCTHREQDWRVHCFDFFAKEGREVSLDGSTPGIMERRAMTYSADGPTDRHGANGRPLSTANSPTVVAVGAKASPASLHVDSLGPQTFQGPGAEEVTAGIAVSGLPSSPETLPSIAPKSRRRKIKRIVDLDDTDGMDESGHEPRKGHGRHNSDAGILRLPPERRERSSRPQISELSLPQAGDTSRPALPVKGTSSLSRTTGTPIRNMTIDPISLTPSSSRLDSPATVSLAKGAVATRTLSPTLSPTKASKRRARVTASVYEPAGMNVESGRDDKSSTSDADFFRKQIEALRNEVGDSWLKVLSQSQLANSGKSMIHREG